MSFFVRRALRLPQIRSQAASFTQRRGLADAAGKDGAAKVHFWQQPLNPSKWKDGQAADLVTIFASILVLCSIEYHFPCEGEKEGRPFGTRRSENKEDLSNKASSV